MDQEIIKNLKTFYDNKLVCMTLAAIEDSLINSDSYLHIDEAAPCHADNDSIAEEIVEALKSKKPQIRMILRKNMNLVIQGLPMQ